MENLTDLSPGFRPQRKTDQNPNGGKIINMSHIYPNKNRPKQSVQPKPTPMDPTFNDSNEFINYVSNQV